MGSLVSPAVVLQHLKQHPIIPALRSAKDVARVCRLSRRVVFLLGASLLTYREYMKALGEAEHVVFVHLDLLEGLKADSTGFSFLLQQEIPQGVISTHKNILALAKKNNILGLLRVFMLDSEALSRGVQVAQAVKPDFVELLPGSALPLLEDRKLRDFALPIIAGGLITNLEQVHAVLRKNVAGVSTSDTSLW